MSNYLFGLWDGGGAEPPILSVAGALAARGHDVRVMADPVQRDAVEAAGCRHVAWTSAPHRTERTPETDLIKDWEVSPPAGFARMIDGLICGPAGRFAADVRAELARKPADVVASEALLLGPAIAAEAEGIPSVLLTSTLYVLPAPGRPPFGPGFKPARGPLGRVRDKVFGALGRKTWEKGLPALNAARAEHGLEPLESVFDQYGRADRVLVLSSEAFDYDAELPGNARHVGPRLDDIHGTEPWTAPTGTDPLVLVGMSTTYMDQLDVLGRVVDALAKLPVRAVVTTGDAIDPSQLDPAPNVTVVRSAPHSEVLPQAAAVVTHAGHGTAMKALAHGVPLVCLPMGRDQSEVSARVVAAGAGLRLKPKASPDAIARAVGRVLDEPAFGAAAARMRAAIAAECAEDEAAAELERVARRPGGGAGSLGYTTASSAADPAISTAK